MKTDEVKQKLHDAISAVLPAWHVAIDGDQSPAAAYSLQEARGVYESGELLCTTERWQLMVFQRNYDSAMIDALIESLRSAGFGVRRGRQEANELDYVTELTATMKYMGG